MGFLSPENYVEGGGLLDDVDVTFKEVRVENWDYNGKVATPVPALKVSMEVEGVEGLHSQYYSIGKGTDWQPSEDGTRIVAVGKATGIVSSSNAAILISSMVNAGFPGNKIEDDVRCFEGLRAHMTRIPAPKREGIVKAPREDGKSYESTILTVGKIISLPWENKKTAAAAPKGKPNTAAKTSTPAPAASAEEEDLDAICTEVLMEVLAEKGVAISKSQIPALVLPKVKDRSNKNKIITRVFAEEFLQNGPWTYDKGKVSMA